MEFCRRKLEELEKQLGARSYTIEELELLCDVVSDEVSVENDSSVLRLDVDMSAVAVHGDGSETAQRERCNRRSSVPKLGCDAGEVDLSREQTMHTRVYVNRVKWESKRKG